MWESDTEAILDVTQTDVDNYDDDDGQDIVPRNANKVDFVVAVDSFISFECLRLKESWKLFF